MNSAVNFDSSGKEINKRKAKEPERDAGQPREDDGNFENKMSKKMRFRGRGEYVRKLV